MSVPRRWDDVNELSSTAIQRQLIENNVALAKLKNARRKLPPVWLYREDEMPDKAAVDAALAPGEDGAFIVVGPVVAEATASEDEDEGTAEDTEEEAARGHTRTGTATKYHFWSVKTESDGLHLSSYNRYREAVVTRVYVAGGDSETYLTFDGERYNSVEQVVAANPAEFRTPVANERVSRRALALEEQMQVFEMRNAELIAAHSRILSIVDMVVVSGGGHRVVQHMDHQIIPQHLLDRDTAHIHELLELNASVSNPAQALIFYGDMQILTSMTTIREMMRRLEFETRRPPRILVLDGVRVTAEEWGGAAPSPPSPPPPRAATRRRRAEPPPLSRERRAAAEAARRARGARASGDDDAWMVDLR